MTSSIFDDYLNHKNDTSLDYDDNLNLIINTWVKKITGLPENLIRPLWQQDPPVIPKNGINWCAFGVDTFTSYNPVFEQLTEYTDIRQNEELTVLMRFYGQQSQKIANQFRISVLHPQNNYQLNKLGFTIGKVSQLVAFPELINDKWHSRHDLSVFIRRRTNRVYDVKSLLQSDIKFI